VTGPTMRRVNLLLAAASLVLLQSGAFPCWAGPALTAQPNSADSYSLDVSGLQGATLVEITVGYDAESASNPLATRSGIATRSELQSVNEAGVLTITITRPKAYPLSGSGSVANLKFTRVGNLPAKLTFLSAYYQDKEDRRYSLEAAIVNAPGNADSADKDARVAPEKKEQGAAAKVSGGGPRGSAGGPLQPQAAEASTARGEASPGADASRKVLNIPSVLERFRETPGPIAADLLQTLFARTNAAGIRQEPEVMLSDGAAEVTVTVPFDSIHGSSPNFYLDGMHLVRLELGDTGWLLTLLPKKASYTARLTVVGDTDTIRFPLTVAPQLQNLPAECPEYLRQYVLASNYVVSLRGR